MSIPGISTLKTWGLAALGFALAVVYAMFQVQVAGRAKDKLALEVENRKVQAQAIKEINKGLNNEIKTQSAPIDPNYFS